MNSHLVEVDDFLNSRHIRVLVNTRERRVGGKSETGEVGVGVGVRLQVILHREIAKKFLVTARPNTQPKQLLSISFLLFTYFGST